MAEPDLWDEKALVNIYDTANTVNLNIAAMTDSVDIDLGDLDGESIPTIAGTRLWKRTTGADTTITFEGYPIDIGDVDSITPKGLIQFFEGGTDSDQALEASSSTTRNKFRVTIMWTDDPSSLSARDSVASGYYALRYDFQNCYFVSCKPAFTDKILKTTWKFKCPMFNSSGTSNVTAESVDGTAAMSMLPVTSTKTIESDAVID